MNLNILLKFRKFYSNYWHRFVLFRIYNVKMKRKVEEKEEKIRIRSLRICWIWFNFSMIFLQGDLKGGMIEKIRIFGTFLYIN